VGSSGTVSIAYYVSAHGYGHGVRSCDIIRAVRRLYPQINIHVVTDLPEMFLSGRLGPARVARRPGSFDVGMVQIDSIRIDIDATLERVEHLHARRGELTAGECQWLREQGIRAVVADIPALPIEAASRAGIPSLAVANFSWDWIYSAYVERNKRWRRMADFFREGYSRAGLLLRLPFCGPMPAFPRVEDIPLVASPGNSRRGEIASLAGCDSDSKWALLSFTTLDLGAETLQNIGRIRGWEFFTVLPLQWRGRNVRPLDGARIPFSDIVASMDVVVSKPGFGILSDCVVNRKPLVYAERRDFLEYPVLEEAVRKYLRHVHIPAAELYRGELGDSLEKIWDAPEPREALPHGGDIIAARRIAGLCGLPPLSI
jgi:L-arabinokinase